MATTNDGHGNIVLDMTEDETRHFYAYVTWRGAIRLEKVGLKHRGGSVRLHAIKHLGMKRSASHDEVIAELDRRIEACKAVHAARVSGNLPSDN